MDRSQVANQLWTPHAASRGRKGMDDYIGHVNKSFHLSVQDPIQLHEWSVANPQHFWTDLYRYLELRPSLPASLSKAYDEHKSMSSNPPFFSDIRMNYAENAVFSNPNPNAVALVGIREAVHHDERDNEIVTWAQFRDRVRLVASALRRTGIRRGDRVAALVATSVFAVVLFHATASIGAIFTCVSPDLGVEGCVSRFQQVTPSILFADSHILWKGRSTSSEAKVDQIVRKCQPKPQVYFVPVGKNPPGRSPLNEFLTNASPKDPLSFTKVSFNDPLFICYSSGTTGNPKCIVHRHGVILQLKKIAMIHNSTTPTDVILQYSSTSWIVFYIKCGYLASGAQLILYNGSPMYPDRQILLRLASKYRATYFGTSPRYLLELEMNRISPKNQSDLSSLRIVYTTGAILSAEQYLWFYSNFPSDIHLCNTAGGTDIATSLVAGNPCGPVFAGEMQMFALGMDIDILHPESSKSILRSGGAGELVVKKPFPSMPCFFWGDADGSRFRETYFDRFPEMDVWAQADWLSQNPKTGGFIMHGRSDGVLNPSGIRFGSGEIYAIVEGKEFNDRIVNSLCVGRRRPCDTDEEVFLFLVMAPKHPLTPLIITEIRRAITRDLSPRHVPKFIFAVPDIPTTINGKKVESAVKRILSGDDVTPSNTVQNPESFALFPRYQQVEGEGQARATKL